MAWICDKTGQQKCEIKKLSYNGVFMDVSSITVTVESAVPIAFAIGDYIDWDYDGLRYTLDAAAGVEKQARKQTIGNAFVYDNLVFLSPLKAADNAEFLDVIIGNTNEFLTNTEFSFYGTAWDYAKRLEANLCRMYGDGSWKVRIWTGGTCYDETPATGINTGSWENKLVDVSGIKCLGGFQQIYDLWGCAYVFSVNNGVNYVDFYDDFEQYAQAWKESGVDKIFAYGKGNGLYKIRHTQDTDHVLVTRLRPYGSSDNLPANYYLNSPDYHVDGNESSELAISRLMLPASQWTKNGVKQPANAYLEQNTDLYGVREASVCWDGSDPELGEIKPTIYNLTIQDLLDLMASGTTYRPNTAKWPDTSQRIDKIITGAAPTDNGAVAEAGYDFTVVESNGALSAHEFGVMRVNKVVDFSDLVMGTTPSISHLAEFRIVPTSSNTVAVSFDVPDTVVSAISLVTAYLTPYVGNEKVSDATFPCAVSHEEISVTEDGVHYTRRYKIRLLDSAENPIVFSTMLTGQVTFRIYAQIDFISGREPDASIPVIRAEYAVAFNLLRGNKAIDKFFSVTIPQVGFDLAAAVTSGARLCMRSGANQPREFQIVPSSVRYIESSDTWYFRCKRSLDQSISTYFPNSDSVIAAGDEFYFSGIAMPALYVEIAAQKLLTAATAWLALHSKPRMLSSVDVDNKIMAKESIVLKEGMSLPLSDTDLGITPQNQESRIIDNIRIEEGSDSIRTFSITLRDKKEKSSLDQAIRGATSNFATSSSVAEAIGAVDNHDHGALSGRDMPNQHPISAITGLEEALATLSFFEKDGNGGIKLKDEYTGLWTAGFLTAGGPGSGGGGGGGGADLTTVWASLQNTSDDTTRNSWKIATAHLPSLGAGLAYTDNGESGANLSTSLSIASGYKLPTNEEWAGIASNLEGLQALQSQIDSVASRNCFDELMATAIFSDIVAASALYAGSIELNGTDLATTLSGYFLASNFTAPNIVTTLGATAVNRATADASGNNIANTYATNTALNGVSNRVTTLESRQNWDEIFGIDSNGNVYVKKQTVGGEEVARGFWNYGFVTAGGPGSGGGGGGTDLTEVWATLQNTSSDTTHNAWKISTVHLPTLGAGLVYTDDAESGANLDTTLGIASGYKLPTVEEWSGIVSNLEGLQALQGQVDSVASRDSFDELIASALFADILSAGAVYASSIEVGGVNLESSYGASISVGVNSLKLMAKDGTAALSSLTGADIVTVLSTNSVARATGDVDGNAIKTSYGASLSATSNSLKLLAKDGTTALTSLTGSDIVTVLSTHSVARATGDADGNAIKSSYGASLTAASDALKLMAKDGTTTLSTITGDNIETVLADRYVHNTTDTMTGALGVGYGSAPSGGEGSSAKENRRIYFGGSSYYIELTNVGTSGSPVWAFHFSHGLYSDSFVTAGGPGSSGGGSTDITSVWASLQNTDSDTTRNAWKIASAHLPTLGNGLAYTDNGGSGAGLGVTLGVASGYKLPTNSEWENISDNLAGLQVLQAQIDSVASRDGFDEVIAATIFADVAAVSALYSYSIELNGADLATTLAGKQATISDLSTIRSRADEGHTAYGWGNHANAGYFAASSFTAANIVSTLGATAVNRATADASGENISDSLSTVSASIQSLQAQINAVASRDVHDELSVASLFVDTLAVSKIFADGIDFGGYTFGASGSVMQWNGSALFSSLSSSATTNLSITIGGQNRTTALYATYDSSSENISDKFSIVSSALQSLQNQINSVVAAVGSADEIYAGCGFFNTLSVGDGIYAGSVLAMGYVTAGASASSSDARLKNNIKEISGERAIDLIMKLRGVEWDWNEKNACLEGRHGSGLVAQEVEKVMPWMVLDFNDELSLTYNSLFGVTIPGLQNHETRIQTLEREHKDFKRDNEKLRQENAELKRQLNTLTH